MVVRLSALRIGCFLPPGNTPGTHFYRRLSRPQGHSAVGRIMSMKNKNIKYIHTFRTDCGNNFCIPIPENLYCYNVVRNWVLHFLRLTYLLTPRSRILLEKLTGSQLDKKFPAFYGTRRFTTAFTSARHLSLSWARSIQSIPPHPTSCRSILIF